LICACSDSARAGAEVAVPADLASDGFGTVTFFFIRGVTVIESTISRVLLVDAEKTPKSRNTGFDPENHVI
jgi:hypothetical protein